MNLLALSFTTLQHYSSPFISSVSPFPPSLAPHKNPIIFSPCFSLHLFFFPKLFPFAPVSARTSDLGLFSLKLLNMSNIWKQIWLQTALFFVRGYSKTYTPHSQWQFRSLYLFSALVKIEQSLYVYPILDRIRRWSVAGAKNEFLFIDF